MVEMSMRETLMKEALSSITWLRQRSAAGHGDPHVADHAGHAEHPDLGALAALLAALSGIALAGLVQVTGRIACAFAPLNRFANKGT